MHKYETVRVYKTRLMMKRLLAILTCVLIALGIWGAYVVWFSPTKDVAYYEKAVNAALEENKPQLAFDLINQGIDTYPNQLDFRLGKVYMCQMLADYTCMQNELIRILEDAADPSHQWHWTDGSLKGKEFMLGVIQNYQKILWEADKIQEMRKVADLILYYYPDHVESLNTVAASYLSEGDLTNAEAYLYTAEQIDPQDKLVRSNMEYLKKLKEKQ